VPVELAPPSCPDAVPWPAELALLPDDPFDAAPSSGVVTGAVPDAGVDDGGPVGWSVPDVVFDPPPAGVTPVQTIPGTTELGFGCPPLAICARHKPGKAFGLGPLPCRFDEMPVCVLAEFDVPPVAESDVPLSPLEG
jgi:hypothetical protein